MRLLDLPSEILLLIFRKSSTIRDACTLARTCSRLHGLFSPRSNKITILRSAANVPRRPRYAPEKDVPALVRIPPLSWAFASSENPKCGLLLELDYAQLLGKPYTALWDVGVIQRRHSESRTFIEDLTDFLLQFQDLDRRWPRHYSDVTTSIVAIAGELQLEILDRSKPSFIPVDLSSETTVIALALHLHLLLRDLSIVDVEHHRDPDEVIPEDGSPATILDPSFKYLDRPIPTTRIRKKHGREWAEKYEAGTTQDKPKYSLEANPHAMLEYIVQTSFRLLDTHDPRHWPTVLCTILLLYLSVASMRPGSPWMSALEEASKPLLALIKDLARYYYVSTDGGCLPSQSWDEEDFAARVGHDEVVIKYANFLNELWVEADHGELEYLRISQGIEGFPQKLDFFANGCETWVLGSSKLPYC